VTLATVAIDWYAARAGGIVACVLLSCSVILGLALAGKEQLRDWPRFALEDVHRFAGLLAGVFVVVHVSMIAVDSQARFSLSQLVIPFASSYRPFWTGVGIVAAELLLALALVNRYRSRISYRLWRRLHYLNFVVWTAATAHGLGSGTDRGTAWLLGIYLCAIGAVVAMTVRRFLRPTAPAERGRQAPAAAP
jgi:sulfoxide reductase heme-binding subunit YedZ